MGQFQGKAKMAEGIKERPKSGINKTAVLVALILGLSAVALISYGYRTRRDSAIKQTQDEVFERTLEAVRAK